MGQYGRPNLALAGILGFLDLTRDRQAKETTDATTETEGSHTYSVRN